MEVFMRQNFKVPSDQPLASNKNFCTNCRVRSRVSEAMFLCTECPEYFCRLCIRRHDKREPNHTLFTWQNSVWKIAPEAGSRESFVFSFNHVVRLSTDGKTCYVTGSCFLPNGSCVLIDYGNNMAKLFDSNYFLMDVLELPEAPHDVCYMDNNTMAVTVNNTRIVRHNIYFLQVRNGNLDIAGQLEIPGHMCNGIAYHDGYLFIGSRTALYKYTIQGQLVKKLYEDLSNSTFSTVRKIAVSDNGSKIYITNYAEDTLVTLDQDGNRLSILGGFDFDSPIGVCVADDGTVWICGYGADNISQVDSEGRHGLATFTCSTRHGNNSLKTRSMAMDRNGSKILIGQRGDTIAVIKLK